MSTTTIPAEIKDAAAVDWRPTVNPWMVATSVMLAAFMVLLDSSIANVALPHIAGSLSASTDESTWVLTSYLVANGIMLPASGWLARRIGRKRLLMLSILSFTLASMLCGMSLNMPMLIVARVLQGVGRRRHAAIGAIHPAGELSPEKHGKAMAAYGVGIVVAPIIGPTLGGWITDSYSWHWIFYINLPVGLLALFMSNLYIEDPPYLRHAFRGAIDSVGFGLMAVWLGTMQLVLDKGQEADWFEASWICWLTALSAAAFLGFVAREFLTRDPIVQLRALNNRNFGIGTLITGLLGILLYGVTAFMPLFLQTVLGYSALDSGLAVSPRGLGSLLSMIVVGFLVNRIDSRILLAVGLGGFGLTSLAVEPHQPGDLNERRGLAELLQWLLRRIYLCPSHHAGHGPAAQGGDGQRRGHLQPGAQCRRQHRHCRADDRNRARHANAPELPGRSPYGEQPCSDGDDPRPDGKIRHGRRRRGDRASRGAGRGL